LSTQDKNQEKATKAFEEEVLTLLPFDIKSVLLKIDHLKLKNIEEIRLRSNKPLMIENRFGDWFVSREGQLTKDLRNEFIVNREQVEKALESICENSLYAYIDEIRNGFVTVRGGHRVGLAGRVVMEGSGIKNIKDVSALNIRISREVPACSEDIIRYIADTGTIHNTLIISPPQCGKTTLLRDLARSLGDGVEALGIKGVKVGVIDERSEIAACYKGVPQNNIGMRTDVLDACPKALGMLLAIRSLSPHVIMTDEIGNQGDKDAIMKVINAGVKIITTAHGYSISELKTRQEVLSLIEEKVFERYIVLSKADGPGTIEEVIDGSTMSFLYRRSGLCC
jgi:stage III sporulation protein AA